MRDRTCSLTSGSWTKQPERPEWLRARLPDSSMKRQLRAVPLEQADDRELVRAFVDGDREAFDVIVRRHQRNVYQLCYRFAGNHEDAADWSQDVFVRIFKALPRFKGEAALSTWMYRVCVNACLNRVSAKRVSGESLDAASRIEAPGHSPFDQVLHIERAAAVRAAVEKLPPKQRAAIVLRVYHQLSHEEIAEILESSVGAVKANFFHALTRLKRALQLT